MPSLFAKIRQKWKNYVDDQTANPLKLFRPTTLADLRAILAEARAGGYRVKAIGSGHSSSDIAISRDFMIDTHGLDRILDNGMLDLEMGVAGAAGATGKGVAGPDDLFFVECGIRISAVNLELEKRGKALVNMGAYDGQTLAGVISTSTHGSGVVLDAFPGYVQAIIMIAEDGTLYHIERSKGKGISRGPVRLGGEIKFIQDDDHFLSAGVSMGCMGIIYAVVISVRKTYMLRETREFSWWSDVKRKLEDGSDLRDNRHLEVLVSPYPYANGDYKCMVTRRNIEPEIEYRSPLIRRGHRKWLPELLVTIVPDFILDGLMRLVVNHFPGFTPALVRLQLNSLTDRDYIDKSYKVLNLGKYNNLAAFATEISLPATRYIAAVKEIIGIVERSRKEGKQYLTAPFSLRFVKTNDFYLSMQYGHPGEAFVCMIEFPTISGAIGGVELLDRIESALYAYGGIPHWGQINHVGGRGKASLTHLYPRYNDWIGIYRQLSPCGRFENDFSRRCGISANE